MRDEQLTFLRRLIAEIGPSGFEGDVGRVWREEAARFADEVTHDVVGNSYAWLRGPEGSPIIAIESHIDEIGLQVTHIDEQGFLWVGAVGGWDATVLVGQRIRFKGTDGEVVGVVGRKATHLMSSSDREKAPELKSLWVDIGASTRADARMRLRVGDFGVVDAPWIALTGDLVSSRGVDNRAGAWVALSALERLAAVRPAVTVVALAATREEISFAGAATGALATGAAAAIVIDVTHATDYPETDKRQNGDVKLGGGPVITRGASLSPVVTGGLIDAAEAAGLTYTLDAAGSNTWTDAEGMVKGGRGVACGLVSIPLRYMHSPNETISLNDLDACAEVIVTYVTSLPANPDFRC